MHVHVHYMYVHVCTLYVYMGMQVYNVSTGGVIGSPGFFGTGAAGNIYISVSRDSALAPSTCTHMDDMVVFCGGEVYSECETGLLRLGGSERNNEGRVQICVENKWGTVCDDSWHITSSILTCGLLEMFGGERISASNFGIADDLPIFLDDVKCKGSESNLLSCNQLPFDMSHDCTHQEDVALRCLGQFITSSSHYHNTIA